MQIRQEHRERANRHGVAQNEAGGAPPASLVWKIEGKFPNTTGLSTNLATNPALLVARLDWNDDGSLQEFYATNLSTGVITTNRVPVNPDRAYLWVNPDPNLPVPSPETATASAVGVRNATQRGDFLYSFNRVGFRGGDGTVRRLPFDACGAPQPSQIVRDGLAFPDGLGILPGALP